MKRKDLETTPGSVPACKCGKCVACEKENIERAFIFRDAIVNAFAWEKTAKLEVLVKQLISFNPSVGALAQTGIGRLLFDNELWKKMDPSALAMLSSVKQKWKAAVDSTCISGTASTSTKCSLVQLKGKSYLDSVHLLQTWLLELDIQPVETHIARRVAISFVNNGLTSWSHLDGLYASDLVVSNTLPADSALISRAISVASATVKSNRTNALHPGSNSVEVVVSHFSSADDAALKFNPLAVLKAEQEWLVEAKKLGISGLGVSLKPSQATEALAAARLAGKDVHSLLDRRVEQMKLETNKKSLATVCSGLRSWHCFATEVLGYDQRKTLPPAHSLDVMRFVTIFKCASTGCNYVGYIKWTCTHLRLSTDWFDEELQLVLKGARKLSLRIGITSAVDKQLLNDTIMAQVIALADLRGLELWACQALVSWEFLLRVQSEAIDLEVGQISDATSLPSHRHSGMWMEPNGVLSLRLQRRKHRATGSLLRRTCQCRVVGLSNCVAHRLQPLLAQKLVGTKLFSYTATQFLSVLRKLLTQLSVQHSSSFTLKAFRAGKATALAISGAPLGQILAAGEWRSRAVLNYVDEDVFDGAQLVAREIELSDCE